MSGTSTSISQMPIVKQLLASRNPSIVYKTRVNLLCESPGSPQVRALRAAIGSSENARRLLSHRLEDGTIYTNPYRKFQGPLWTLASLALIDYPEGDASLYPMRDQVYGWLLADEHLHFPRSVLYPGQEERFRRCAGQEAFAVWFTLKLGIADECTDLLVQRLINWQWPDGGWNCDKRPQARISSYYETLLPLRALNYYGKLRNSKAALAAAERAAEVLLKRRLFKRLSDGTIIHPNFTTITYPFFYHYNILPALVTMAEVGHILDERCRDALDVLESKRLNDGGFPLERVVYKSADAITSRGTFADWGTTGKRRMNELVTVDALYALKGASRLG
jgi:hypothetical protein